jgi:hypothetical protein
MSFRASWISGSERNWNMTANTRPVSLATWITLSASETCTAIGFSLMTCRPARIASMAMGGWK